MDRTLLKKLSEWKESKDRSPVMLDGARQVGKSYLIEKLFGEKYFKKVFKLNFEDTPSAKELFSNSIKANDLLEKVSLSNVLQGIYFSQPKQTYSQSVH